MVSLQNKSDGTTLLRIEGEMNIYCAAALKQELLGALGSTAGAPLLLDLSEVSEMDTSGFQLLLLIKREAKAAGRSLGIWAHSEATRTVVELFNMAGYFAPKP